MLQNSILFLQRMVLVVVYPLKAVVHVLKRRITVFDGYFQVLQGEDYDRA